MVSFQRQQNVVDKDNVEGLDDRSQVPELRDIHWVPKPHFYPKSLAGKMKGTVR
jgi:hypothetical protein